LSLCRGMQDMNQLNEAVKLCRFTDRRGRSRSTALSNPMVEIRFSGGPLFQLKVRDLSNEGAGIVVRSDSHFLKMVQVGQRLNVRLILPLGYKGPSGHYRSRVEHITAIVEGPYNGHLIVGISLLAGIN
jgi:hypothetical protein